MHDKEVNLSFLRPALYLSLTDDLLNWGGYNRLVLFKATRGYGVCLYSEEF